MRFHVQALPPGLGAHAPAVWLASCAHLGRLRPAPGSWASAATVLAGAPLVLGGHAAWLALAALAAGLGGMWAARQWLVSSRTEDADPQSIVIDEVMGQALVLAVAPPHLAGLLLAFLLFRFFDIVKVWPARRAEALPHAWGIMLDDAVAGLWGALCLAGLTAAGAFTMLEARF